MLETYDWSSIYASSDPQEAYTLFHNCFVEMYNDSFPLHTVKHGYKNRKPWLTDGLKTSIKISWKIRKKSFRVLYLLNFTYHTAKYDNH